MYECRIYCWGVVSDSVMDSLLFPKCTSLSYSPQDLKLFRLLIYSSHFIHGQSRSMCLYNLILYTNVILLCSYFLAIENHAPLFIHCSKLFLNLHNSCSLRLWHSFYWHFNVNSQSKARVGNPGKVSKGWLRLRPIHPTPSHWASCQTTWSVSWTNYQHL